VQEAQKYAASREEEVPEERILPVCCLPGTARRADAQLGRSAGSCICTRLDANGSHSFGLPGPPVIGGLLPTRRTHRAFGLQPESFTQHLCPGWTLEPGFSYACAFYDDSDAIFTGVTRTGPSAVGSAQLRGPAAILDDSRWSSVPASGSC